jgi:hypothetical protein
MDLDAGEWSGPRITWLNVIITNDFQSYPIFWLDQRAEVTFVTTTSLNRIQMILEK